MNATHLSDPVIFSRLVAFSIIPVFLIVGFICNIFVVYIYAQQPKKSNVETFILLLAVIDLIGCIFGMPLEMAELYPAIQSKYLCKLYKFVVFNCSAISSLILLIIAIERFRKVRCPNGKQITPKLRQTLIIFITVTSVALGLPNLFYFEGIPFTHENKIYMICDFDLTRASVWSYTLAGLIIFIIFYPTMTVLYLFVQKTVTQHFKKKQGKEEALKQRGITRINIVLISISVLFFVSFSPTFVFFVIYPYCKDSNLLQILKVALYRTWILNSSLNPLVYGFCNKIFRKSLVNIFTRGKVVFEMEEKF
uniref:G-protein coupled receptors family 1 profile domain-containing protein n=1 Tax=Octopus bimaculoides TaxID=37653 RepID=A0A0L8I6D4_OCTBM|eukprot:XP_014790450.1 PREDICTED: neuropeptide Y receptor type 6-like [Octopus bimaculoides]